MVRQKCHRPDPTAALGMYKLGNHLTVNWYLATDQKSQRHRLVERDAINACRVIAFPMNDPRKQPVLTNSVESMDWERKDNAS